MTGAYKIENILDNPNVTEVLPNDTAIAFNWVAREYGISIGEKNIERVKKFSQLELKRIFYVVVHGLRDEQIDQLKTSFGKCPNVKVVNFKSLKLDNQYDLPTIKYTENGKSKRMRLSQYWNDMYSEKVTRRMHISNEADSMKFSLLASSDQIVGSGNPLAVFDFDTLPAEGKKIGDVKIIKGGVLLACLPKDVSTLKKETLDVPILAISKEGNAILKTLKKKIIDDSTTDPFFTKGHMTNMIVSTINHGNTVTALKLLGLDQPSLNSDTEYEKKYNEEYDRIWEAKELLFAFNRTENVIIISDGSWHYKNRTSGAKKEQVNTGTTSELVTLTTPQQTQPTNGGSQPITGSATPLPQTPIVNGTNNNLPTKNQDSQPLIGDDKKHNPQQNHFLGISPRGWIIIAAGAVVGALALYFLAPLILGATVAIDAQLGLMASGAVAGGVIGYFTDVVINKCYSEPVVQTA